MTDADLPLDSFLAQTEEPASRPPTPIVEPPDTPSPAPPIFKGKALGTRLPQDLLLLLKEGKSPGDEVG